MASRSAQQNIVMTFAALEEELETHHLHVVTVGWVWCRAALCPSQSVEMMPMSLPTLAAATIIPCSKSVSCLPFMHHQLLCCGEHGVWCAVRGQAHVPGGAQQGASLASPAASLHTPC